MKTADDYNVDRFDLLHDDALINAEVVRRVLGIDHMHLNLMQYMPPHQILTTGQRVWRVEPVRQAKHKLDRVNRLINTINTQGGIRQIIADRIDRVTSPSHIIIHEDGTVEITPAHHHIPASLRLTLP